MTVTLRDFATLDDYEACLALQDDIWGAGFSERVPIAILRVAQKVGGVSAGAFDSAGRLVGFVFGMTGVRDGAIVHWSDMLAVRPETRGTGLAERLKNFQRDRVRALGATEMLWTADPLVARNAHFNINRLGARPAEYVVNMYGEHTGSVLHGAMPTDRFVYRWPMDVAPAHEPRVEPSSADAAFPAVISVAADGTPTAHVVTDAPGVRVSLPHDLEVVQSTSAARAVAWRMAVRTAMQDLLGRGYAVTRFVRGDAGELPYYVLTTSR